MNIYQKTLFLNEENFQRDVGISRAKFFWLVEKLEAEIALEKARNRLKQRGRKDGLRVSEKLLLTLLYMRHYPTFANLSKQFDISESYANKIYHYILDRLVRLLPVKNKKHLLESELRAVAIDVTEQPIQRPKQKQRAYYSGKQRQHTIKVQLVVCLMSLSILSVYCAKGRVHDFRMLTQSRPFAALRPLIPTEAEKVADKGYQGIAKLYQNSTIPIKKPKNKPLKSKQSDLIERYRNDGLASNMSIADAKSSGLPNSDTVASTKTMAKS